jgi:hypothetical protein
MAARVSLLFVSAACLLVSATAAFADVDPALFQDGTNCSDTFWCAGTGVAVDPNTGDSTLEFLMNVPTPGKVDGITTPFDTGWVEAETGSTLDFLLDFEIVGGHDAIFLYCGQAKCTADDVGLPTKMPTVSASFILGNTFTPAPGQPGYGVSYTPNSDATPIYGIVTGPNVTFTLPFVSGIGVVDVPVPEPSGVLELAFMMIAAAAFARKWQRARLPR